MMSIQYHLILHSSLMGILKYTYSCNIHSCSGWKEFMVWLTLDTDRGPQSLPAPQV
jgi:hypothetical protein